MRRGMSGRFVPRHPATSASGLEIAIPIGLGEPGIAQMRFVAVPAINAARLLPPPSAPAPDWQRREHVSTARPFRRLGSKPPRRPKSQPRAAFRVTNEGPA